MHAPGKSRRLWANRRCLLGAGAVLVASAGVLLGSTIAPHGSGAALDDPEFAPGLAFQRDVLPILRGACFECHGAAKRSGRLRLDSREAALAGGRGGTALVPGDPAGSLLMVRVRGEGGEQQMPLDREALAPGQIRALEAWIEAGAPWPADPHAGDGAHAAEARHWAYVPPQKVEVPQARGPRAGWPRNDIDAFVLARLEREGLGPSNPAPPAVLLRRLHLDLVGLPPTVEDVLAFESDDSEAAYLAHVDRLLASPRFGEKWARHWLDLARYADSRGFEKDGLWSMWPYRDWVIGAFNADMPFDRFTIEQIAGDLLPGATLEHRVATGFNRCTMINEEGGTDPEEQRVAAVMDRTATTAAVWLGSTLGCAQCHDHKYDPFSQKEYYEFFAFFNQSPAETRQNERAEIEITSYAIEVPADPAIRAPAEVRAALAQARLDALPPEAPLVERRAWAKELSHQQARLKPATTQVMREVETPRETRILARGSFLSPAEVVEPAVPAVLGALGEDGSGGRRDRLALARWIASARNPLTARVAANRLWAEVFGRGLVDTPEDFGTRGSPPSHPELLDFLATRLIEGGWSQKALIRLIVTSATYRQDSAASSEMRDRDPDNRLLARGARFRLEGELVRDSALASSGLLRHRLGGPSVYPPQPAGVWSNPYYTEPYVQSLGEDRYRRGLYTVWKRSSPYPTFLTFDAPQRQVSCSRRSRTNTALQAMTTLNDPAFVEAAVGLGWRVLRHPGPGDVNRIEHLWRLVLARAPGADESARLQALLDQQRARYAREPMQAARLLAALPGGAPAGIRDERLAEAAAWTIVASVVLNLDEALCKP